MNVKLANLHPSHPQPIVALRGQVLSSADVLYHGYQVLAGEVLIVRNGRTVDLVEAGEWLNAQIWPGATAMAWTDCILQDAAFRQPTVELM
ncbi:MAG: hypothetical protein R2911_19440, partial [Caldilineaceae bacterium]